MRFDDWFLTPEERGNPSTEIDRRRGGHVGWTENNHVAFLIDGATYFTQLAKAFEPLERGDEVRFADWRSDGDECLFPGGPTVGDLIAQACRNGVDVRGLLWRSHSDRFAFSAKENRRFAKKISKAGGEVLLDERVRRGGSHHQKLFLIRRRGAPDQDVAFVGGIDLSHGRRDDNEHHGNEQAIKLDERYGAQPAWHDVQLEVRGPAIGDLEATFHERWEDPTPLNHSSRARAWVSRTLRRDRVALALPEPLADPPPSGGHAVQILRSYPSRRPGYPFAPDGERSVARGFAKAIKRARSLIYLEDQYFWSIEIAKLLATELRRQPQLQLVMVVPRFPDKDGRVSGPPSRFAQQRAIDIVQAAGGDRVGIYDVQNDAGSPIYVHAKVCVIDDVWATVGSDNLNRRSWTHDSELSCAIIDSRIDQRAPRDPGGLGDQSRTFARDLRVALWAEHLGRAADDPELLDCVGATDLWRRCSTSATSPATVDTESGRRVSRIRPHVIEPVSRGNRWWASTVYRLVFDPDGRPLALRLRRRY